MLTFRRAPPTAIARVVGIHCYVPQFMGLTFKRALNEQLGLNLKPTIAPVDFFVVDHIETPSPN
jgi:uncharacterized protein (TIGR03435 family)